MGDNSDKNSFRSESERGPGQPPHEPTEQNRKTVKMMIAAGLKQAQVCSVLDISEPTLRKYYAREIEAAEPEVFAMIGQSLIFQAIGGPDRDWTKAIPAAGIFIAKTRMGWKEPPQDVNLRGAVGTYDLSKLDDERLKLLESILGTVAVTRGDPSGDSET